MQRPMRIHCWLLAACTVALAGCEGNPDPVQACEDTADAIATAAVRCNLGKYGEVFGEVVLEVGGCERVVAVRDIDLLYDDCFPGIEKLPCEQLQVGSLPASCNNQLIVPAF